MYMTKILDYGIDYFGVSLINNLSRENVTEVTILKDALSLETIGYIIFCTIFQLKKI